MSKIRRLAKRLNVSELEARDFARRVQQVAPGTSFLQIAECLELCPAVSAAGLAPEQVNRLLQFTKPSLMLSPYSEDELRQFSLMVLAAKRLNLSEVLAQGLFMKTQALFQANVPSFYTIVIAIVNCPRTIESAGFVSPAEIADLVQDMRRGEFTRRGLEQRTSSRQQSPQHQTATKTKTKRLSRTSSRRVKRLVVRVKPAHPTTGVHIPPGFSQREWDGDWKSD